MMNKEELRPLIFSILRSQPLNQFDGVKGRLRNLVVDYQNEDDLVVHEILWELLVQGILAPGMRSPNLHLPYIHVTEYGMQVLEAGEVTPHDPDGYLAHMRGLVENPLDSALETYLQEALATFLAGHYFASTELLGVAAERCLDLLSEGHVRSLKEEDQRQTYMARVVQAGRNLTRRIGVLRAELFKRSLPVELKDSLDVLLSGLFTLIRHTRDPAGQPSGSSVTRETAHGNLLLFPSYYQRVTTILSHLNSLLGQVDSSH